ncbi:hypothetical protein SXCC_00512 [Gluconacetobacter sp. SXCC-1]|nr:hypothetical protein SXCC_00512 [Gluconacetobacter sp. SXCC-1]
MRTWDGISRHSMRFHSTIYHTIRAIMFDTDSDWVLRAGHHANSSR